MKALLLTLFLAFSATGFAQKKMGDINGNSAIKAATNSSNMNQPRQEYITGTLSCGNKASCKINDCPPGFKPDQNKVGSIIANTSNTYGGTK